MIDRFIGEHERRRITSLSRSQWWRMERRGLVPKRRHVSTNRVAWLESEIAQWMTERAKAGACDVRA
jgi:predicted DNA-binding transcriptional regulator AlpA